MKLRYTLILLFILCSTTLQANDLQDSIAKPKKFEFKFTGRIDVNIFTDSYKGVESRNGLQWICPAAPVYNNIGDDINKYSTLRFSAAGTRLGVNFIINDILKGATGLGVVEGDFIGVTESVLHSLRLRHAYFSLNWKKRGVLLGQTSHLTMPDEMAANTVNFGGGYPLNPLSRPVQVQYTERFGKRDASLTLAAAMFGGDMGFKQSYSMTPEIQLRATFGDKNRTYGGVVVGFKSIRPNLYSSDTSFTFDKTRVNSFSAAAFCRHIFKSGHTVRVFALWGQDQSPIAMLGGYAQALGGPLLEDKLGYAPFGVYSVWGEFDSKVYTKSKLQYGLFAGIQQNLGTNKIVNPDNVNVANKGLDYFFNVAPRIWWHPFSKITFGLEYMVSGASWAKTMDDHYRPETLNKLVFNHKIMLLARYKF